MVFKSALVTVYGGTPEQKKAVKEAVQFAKREMFPRHTRVKVIVSIIKNLTEKEGLNGDCFDEGDRIYRVRICRALADLDHDEFIKTVLHEMVHVKQYCKCELFDKALITKFKGEKYPFNMAYARQPWEKEARKLEKTLFKKFKKEILDA